MKWTGMYVPVTASAPNGDLTTVTRRSGGATEGH